MKLEIGKSYKNRSGKKVTIEYVNPNNSWPFFDSVGYSYTECGHYSSECNPLEKYFKKHENDLIAEWTDEPASPQPDADDWIEWNGGECPVPEDTLVEVRLAFGAVFGNQTAGFWALPTKNSSNWMRVGSLADIVAYRIAKPADEPEEKETLRDKIAMAALTGMLANPSAFGSYDDFANHSLQYADAMLKARRGGE